MAHAGRKWITRFRRAMQIAHSVKYVTEERFLGDGLLFRFIRQIFHGYADLRARASIPTHLLAVWDGDPTIRVGDGVSSTAGWV